VLATVVRNRNRILPVNCPKSLIITTNDCVAVLDKLRQQLISKLGDKLSGRIFFPQNNASPYRAAITQQK
jgi:hypothetical protein